MPLQAYDVAACKFRGRDALTNFPLENYDSQLEQLAQVTKAELVQVQAFRVQGLSRMVSNVVSKVSART